MDETNLFFHYEYFDEGRAWGEGLIGWYALRIDDPERAVEIADRIDATFANSRFETKTTTEKAFVQAFADQMGNIGAILRAVLGAVFFTILLVAGNTMAQSVRERIGELAVLKTLGYSNAKVLGLMDALFGRNGLDITYGDEETKTASETFDVGRTRQRTSSPRPTRASTRCPPMNPVPPVTNALAIDFDRSLPGEEPERRRRRLRVTMVLEPLPGIGDRLLQRAHTIL